jgi:transketolase
MRWNFAQALESAAAADPRVVLLMGDVGGGMLSGFARRFPNRYFNLGTAEQTLIGVAAGMALEGLRPVVYSFTPFLLERALEQVKLDVVQQRAPVGLVGFTDPGQGPTHHCARPDLLCTSLGLRYMIPDTKEDVASSLQILMTSSAPWFLSLS